MTRPTEHLPELSRQPGPEALPPLLLLESLETPVRTPKDDDWRLSRTAKPLRTWRLSK